MRSLQNKFLIGICIWTWIGCDSVEDKKGRFLLKGNEKLEENDPKSALTYYSEALALDSIYVDAYFNRAMARLRLNQLDETIHDLDKAILIRPDYFEAIFQRGLCYLDNGEFYKAREDASRLNTLDDQNWKTFFLSGLTQEKLKNYPEALVAFEKASLLNPANSDLLVNQATILFYQKEFESAKEILVKAEELNPSEPHLHNLRSMILFEENQLEAALESVEKAISLDNRQAYFYNNRGLYLIFLNRSEEGIDLINQSIQMDPNNQFALRNKGIYYVVKGDKVTALNYLEKLSKLYPDMPLVQEYYQKALAL
jgi:tetratricopeptide (TPR) repeat protein